MKPEQILTDIEGCIQIEKDWCVNMAEKSLNEQFRNKMDRVVVSLDGVLQYINGNRKRFLEEEK